MGFGLALAGGGLKGIAHIGVIQALQELGIKIEYLSGTSSGSIFATMLALGYTVDEMKERALSCVSVLTNIKKKPIIRAGIIYFTKRKLDLPGLMPGENVEEIVKQLLKEKNIYNMNDISLPFAIATVDTISTKECIFLSKNINIQNDDIDYLYNAPIEKAVRASMAFPGIFTTCNYDKYNFIDGGTKDNLPIHILKDMGATKTLGISFKIDDYIPSNDPMSILLRTVDIFSLKDVRNAQKEADLAIEIDASSASLLKVDDIEALVKIGYNTIINQKDKILKILE